MARDPGAYQWDSSLFTPTLDYLPGIPSSHKHFSYVTYPRLGQLGQGVLFLSLRDGKAGLGADHLYLYRAATGFWEFAGTPLTGIDSNPYVHGWDFRGGRLHVTWVYRGFVWYEGWDDPADTKHKRQAGPNGAENNHDICYAYSEDLGYTWRNGRGRTVAELRNGETIGNNAEGIVAFEIPRGSGLMNQEAQAVDHDGGVHVLNRDTLGGRHMWKHYYRSPDGMRYTHQPLEIPWEHATDLQVQGAWVSRAILPVDGPRRGRLAVAKNGDLLIMLPQTTTTALRILRATRASAYDGYEEVWVGTGLTGEPLVDGRRLDTDNVLSLFVRKERDVAVLDFQI